MKAEYLDLRDPYIRLLIRRGEEMAERDNQSAAGPVTREGEAWAKRRAYLEQQGRS